MIESENKTSSTILPTKNISLYTKGNVEILPTPKPNRNCFRDIPKCSKLINTYIQSSSGNRSIMTQSSNINISPSKP